MSRSIRRMSTISAAALLTLGAGCAGNSAGSASNPPEPAAASPTDRPPAAPRPPATTALVATAPTDADIAAAALLTVAQVGPTAIGPVELDWPMDAWLVRHDPACAEFLDPVFNADGHPSSSAGALFPPYGFVHRVIVFPTEALASAMVDAAGSPKFGACTASWYARALDSLASTEVESVVQADGEPIVERADRTASWWVDVDYTQSGVHVVDRQAVVFQRVGQRRVGDAPAG